MSRPAQLTKDSDPMLSQTPATIQPDDIATRQPFKPRDGTDSDKPSEVPCDALFEHTVDRPPSLPPVHVLPAMSWPGPSTRHADDGGTGPASAGHPDVLTPPVTPTQPVSDCFGTGFNLHGPTATPSDQIQTPSATVGGPPGRGPSPGPIPKVRRRARMQYTPQQLMVLEDAFAKNPYPTREGRQILEAMTGLNVERIKIWFQNRRSREKKRERDRQSQSSSTPRAPSKYLPRNAEQKRLQGNIQACYAYPLLNAKEHKTDEIGYVASGINFPQPDNSFKSLFARSTTVCGADPLMKFCPVQAIPCPTLLPPWPYCGLYPGAGLHPHLPPPPPLFSPAVPSLYDLCRSLPATACHEAGKSLGRFPPWPPGCPVPHPWQPTSTRSSCESSTHALQPTSTRSSFEDAPGSWHPISTRSSYDDRSDSHCVPISPPGSPDANKPPMPDLTSSKSHLPDQHGFTQGTYLLPTATKERSHAAVKTSAYVAASDTVACPTLRDLLSKPLSSWWEPSSMHYPGAMDACHIPGLHSQCCADHFTKAVPDDPTRTFSFYSWISPKISDDIVLQRGGATEDSAT